MSSCPGGLSHLILPPARGEDFGLFDGGLVPRVAVMFDRDVLRLLSPLVLALLALLLAEYWRPLGFPPPPLGISLGPLFGDLAFELLVLTGCICTDEGLAQRKREG